MLKTIDLAGTWKLQLDADKRGVQLPYRDEMMLPGTTSYARKGTLNEEALAGSLTDEYKFEGYAWFEREIDIPPHLAGRRCVLLLERTRVTTAWIDGREIGTRNSLSTPHRYELTDGLDAGTHAIKIRVANTGYPTKGGHLTSPDTQTNWNGITGRIELQFYGDAYLSDIRVYPNVGARTLRVVLQLHGDTDGVMAEISARTLDGSHEAPPKTYTPELMAPGAWSMVYPLGEDARFWSDASPNAYALRITLKRGREILDVQQLTVGLRAFTAAGDKFAINGTVTFLRGKHDGLVFPLTGFAPTTVDEWMHVMEVAKSYGINHYRFHTCCPPEAAFEAADRLGIFMEPELPFWGTVTDETYDNHNAAEQKYLIAEGYAMLREFGNHPSFVMMSLGNELWGSKERINEILTAYKAFDPRPLYTQGSNNFQFVPVILEQEDFFCGVRFSRDRLFRGSYAMCDAPLGHVQTDPPSTLKDYDEQIVPTAMPVTVDDGETEGGGGTIQIQYGTEAKTVQAEGAADALVPRIPVVSHEIGQYATFPNFEETGKYTGPLKARNFELFRQRLETRGLGHLARDFFENSGKLAVACYKEELEAAFRTKRLAGFQLLDLQDFPGQGTALVGVLDAFMDSKGLITPEEWRTFCADAVLLARFAKFNYEAGETFEARVQLADYRPDLPEKLVLSWSFGDEEQTYASGEREIAVEETGSVIEIGDIRWPMPDVSAMTRAELSLRIDRTDIWKTYDVWIYPKREAALDWSGIHLVRAWTDESAALLERGEPILFAPDPGQLSDAVAIAGYYSTEFWCYPMFRSISESMNKPVPVGTMGLLVRNGHPALQAFPSETYSTEPWWQVVTHSRSLILDDMPREIEPIVQTIDNFERNHKLGLLFECRVAGTKGRVLVGALDVDKIGASPEGRQLLSSLIGYLKSEAFDPQVTMELAQLRGIYGG